MKRKVFNWRTGTVVLLILMLSMLIAPVAEASDIFKKDSSVSMTLINTAAAFFIFILGVRVVYLTRGGFLSIAFVLITTGITVGWVVKLGFQFLADSAILATSVDIAGIAEAIGGIVLVTGFTLLSEKLKG